MDELINTTALKKSTIEGYQSKHIKDGYVYKLDTMGYESISESLVSELLSCTELDYVDYSLGIWENGESCCVSKDFKLGRYEEITLKSILESVDYGLDMFDRYTGKVRLKYTEDTIHTYTDLPKSELHMYLGTLCKLDALILNEDRNLGNITFLQEGEEYLFCPIFDNGAILLSDTEMYPMGDRKVHCMAQSVRSKPFCSIFLEQVKLFEDVPNIKIDYDRFISNLEYIDNNIETLVLFKKNCYNRAKSILLKQLSRSEGVLWERS